MAGSAESIAKISGRNKERWVPSDWDKITKIRYVYNIKDYYKELNSYFLELLFHTKSDRVITDIRVEISDGVDEYDENFRFFEDIDLNEERKRALPL